MDEQWTIKDSEKLYGVNTWGKPYFHINNEGHLQVCPSGDGPSLDVYDLVQDLKRRGLELPIVLRFSDILAHRLRKLHRSFQKAIEEYQYAGSFQAAYPIKVNQQRHVVEELVQYGNEFNFGMEAGSKPELLIALALCKNKESLIICNGFKDSEYLETALLAQKLGLKTIIVLERFHELETVIQVSRRLKIEPLIGIRARLSIKGTGKWSESGGDRAKFGLNVPEIVEAIDILKKENLLHCLQLLHFHIGSQITDIRPMKEALSEASYIFVELASLGAPMKYLDVGGGLGIDYDGSKTNFHSSKNYTMGEYAADIIYIIQSACKEKNYPVPMIISESGRALVAHHSMVVFDVVGMEDVLDLDPIEPPKPEENWIIKEFYEDYCNINEKKFQEVYHDVVQTKSELTSLFNLGYISLQDRAKAEKIYWGTLAKIRQFVKNSKYPSDEFEELDRLLATNYYCNFSVFQSIPDSWALKQLFPIMPIHRLDEKPTMQGNLSDLTCDSDGKIDEFIDLNDAKCVLPLHKYNHNQSYMMAIFMTGAYQEILGDYHNLFGSTHAVHLRVTEDGYRVEHMIEGDSMTEVLSYLQYEKSGLLESVRRATEDALERKQISIEEARLLIEHYLNCLQNYTYLNVQDDTKPSFDQIQPSTIEKQTIIYPTLSSSKT